MPAEDTTQYLDLATLQVIPAPDDERTPVSTARPKSRQTKRAPDTGAAATPPNRKNRKAIPAATALEGEIQPPSAEAVVDPTVRQELDQLADEIRSRYRRLRDEVFAIGSALLRAKERFPRGGFHQWVEGTVGMQPRMAQMAMQIAEAFSPQDRVAQLFPGMAHLVELARAPEEVREKAIELREAGERVTVPRLKKLRAEHAALAAATGEEAPRHDPLGPALRSLLHAHLPAVQRQILRGYDGVRHQIEGMAGRIEERAAKGNTNPYPRTWAVTLGESARRVRNLIETHTGLTAGSDDPETEGIWHRIDRSLARIEEQGTLAEAGTAPTPQVVFDALAELPRRPQA